MQEFLRKFQYRPAGALILSAISFVVGLVPGVFMALSEPRNHLQPYFGAGLLAGFTALASQFGLFAIIRWLLNATTGFASLFVMCFFLPFMLAFWVVVWPAALIGQFAGWLEPTGREVSVPRASARRGRPVAMALAAVALGSFAIVGVVDLRSRSSALEPRLQPVRPAALATGE
jgi:hypothetical protein